MTTVPAATVNNPMTIERFGAQLDRLSGIPRWQSQLIASVVQLDPAMFERAVNLTIRHHEVGDRQVVCQLCQRTVGELHTLPSTLGPLCGQCLGLDSHELQSGPAGGAL